MDDERRIDIVRHETFPIPVWAFRLRLPEPVELGDGGPDANGDAARSAVLAVIDELADASEIGWRQRSVSDEVVEFAQATDVLAERDSLVSRARATFSAVTWLAAPPEAADGPTVALALRNPYNHLTKRYRLPTYVHHAASPLATLVFPSFLEQFYEAPEPSRPWSSPAVALVTDVHYY